MSLALYRRYRPETFAEVIGQAHVTGPLQQALRNDRIHHAYLFSGPRGCGKTTSARILARALNCERGPTPEPCGVCDSCVALARNGPGSLDVIEIDAASHGGVDDARDLRERAFFSPASSRFKIYIVDEAHMVTTQGFNALLKLVEEPPEHVKFIFATTEPEKVIGTIRSRTHHYPFRLVPPGTLTAYLADLCTREGIEVDPAVLPLVVLAGGGSVRDALSVLDQLLSGADEHGVTYASATALLGYTDASLLDAIVDAIAAGDGAAAFELVDRVVEAGHDPRRFVADLLDRLRDLMLVDAVPDAVDKGLVVGPPEMLAALPAQAARFGRAELVRAAELVNLGLTEMRGATAPRLQLELICARVLLPAVTADELGLAARVDRRERRLSIAAPGVAPAVTATVAPAASHPPAPAAMTPATVSPAAGTSAESSPAAPTPAAARAPAAADPRATPADPRATPAPPSERTSAVDALPPDPGPPVDEPSADVESPAPAARLDVVEVRRLWPTVLEQVKGRRRLTWMLLFEKVTVASVDGNVLVLAFPDPGSLANFTAGRHESILSASMLDALGVELAVQAVLDPSRAAAAAASGAAHTAPSPSAASAPSPSASPSAPSPSVQSPSAPSSSVQSPSAPSSSAPSPAARVSRPSPAPTTRAPQAEPPADRPDEAVNAGPSSRARSTADAYRRAAVSTTPPAQAVRPEASGRAAAAAVADDEPDPDRDPDADSGDQRLSATDLLARELGATVVERVDG